MSKKDNDNDTYLFALMTITKDKNFLQIKIVQSKETFLRQGICRYQKATFGKKKINECIYTC